jgi:hypothetical protein
MHLDEEANIIIEKLKMDFGANFVRASFGIIQMDLA